MMAAFDDIDAVAAQLELVYGVYLLEGREDGDLDVYLVGFISGKRRESRVVESGTLRHLPDGFRERVIGGESADAAAEATVHLQRNKDTVALLLEDANRSGVSVVVQPKGRTDGLPGSGNHGFLLLVREVKQMV